MYPVAPLLGSTISYHNVELWPPLTMFWPSSWPVTRIWVP